MIKLDLLPFFFLFLLDRKLPLANQSRGGGANGNNKKKQAIASDRKRCNVATRSDRKQEEEAEASDRKSMASMMRSHACDASSRRRPRRRSQEARSDQEAIESKKRAMEEG